MTAAGAARRGRRSHAQAADRSSSRPPPPSKSLTNKLCFLWGLHYSQHPSQPCLGVALHRSPSTLTQA
jgi:hypothetical protein